MKTAPQRDPSRAAESGDAHPAGWVHAMYESLSRYAQFANWRAHGTRYGDCTLHKGLDVPAGGASPHAATRLVNDLLLEHAGFDPSPRVLDAGCGFGGTVFHLHEQLGGRYDGYTLSRVQRQAADREARRRGVDGDCRFHLRNYDDPIEERYDAVVAVEALAHAPDLRHTLARLGGALRPGGRLVVAEDMVVGDIDAHHGDEARLLRRHWGCARFPRVEDYETHLAGAGLDIRHRVDLTARVRHRPVAHLDTLARRYRALFRAIPLAPVRGVISAFLGGVALEKLYARGEARYRLLVATKR